MNPYPHGQVGFNSGPSFPAAQPSYSPQSTSNTAPYSQTNVYPILTPATGYPQPGSFPTQVHLSPTQGYPLAQGYPSQTAPNPSPYPQTSVYPPSTSPSVYPQQGSLPQCNPAQVFPSPTQAHPTHGQDLPPTQAYPSVIPPNPAPYPNSSAYPPTTTPASGYPQQGSFPHCNPALAISSSTQGNPAPVQGYPPTQAYPSGIAPNPALYPQTGVYSPSTPASICYQKGSFPQCNPSQGYPAPAQSNPPPQGYQSQTQVNPPVHHGNQIPQGYPSHSQSHHTVQGTYNAGSIPQGVPRMGRPSVVPAHPFDPRKDAEILRKAMKGFGTDEAAIIQVLTRRTNEQRQRIAIEFKTLFGKDLIADLKSETSGNFEKLLLAMMTPLPQFYAKELHDAISGIGTDEDVLIEVMCSSSNREIAVIKQAYQTQYRKNLEDDLRGDTSGSFKRLMTSLCAGNRSEDFSVDQSRVIEDAKALYQAGEKRMGTDESAFNAVLCSRSYPQLIAMFQEYNKLTGHDFDVAIKKEFSGDIENALRSIVKVVRSKHLYFAEQLHKSMKGMGTNDRKLIRVMVTRSEVDLADVSATFQSKYGKSLASWIEGDCSGHYKKCLLGLLGA